MKLLITGCQGFLGSSLAAYAVRRGYEVLGVSRSARDAVITGMAFRRCALDSHDFIDIVAEFVPDLVVHAAGSASVGQSFQQPREDFFKGVNTWGAVLDALRVVQIRPVVIFPSSAAVYGNPSQLPVSEQDPLQPISPYGFHKVISEQLAQQYCRCFGLHVVVARLFSTVGQRQQRLLVWELFRQAVEDSRCITIQGTGFETRDFLHIDDVSEYFLSIMDIRPKGFQALNIGSGVETSVKAIAEHVRQAVGGTHRIHTLNRELPGDPKQWRADVNRLRTLVGHRPRPIHESIEECVRQWLLDSAACVDQNIQCTEPIQS